MQNTQSSENKATLVEEVVRDFDKNEVFEEITAKFTWEQDVERSWNLLVENNGVLQHVSQENLENNSKQKYKKDQIASLRKGIFRHIIILFDMSSSMKERDFKPDRINVVLESLKNSSAKLIQSLTSNIDDILSSLLKERSNGLQGSPSLQEGLEIAHDLLIDMPMYGTKEIVIMYSSIRTCDKNNILNILELLVKNNIYVNCISIAPEMHILKYICERTKGIYKICTSKNELLNEINSVAETPLWMFGMEPQLIHICFPVKKKISTQIMCSCHNNLNTDTYICNFCNSYTCKIPSKCKVCGIHLISMHDLSHITNNLQESPLFIEMKNEKSAHYSCSSCHQKLYEKVSQCTKCKHVFCVECDIFIHEDLNQCPFCLIHHS
ncbi:general transcription factor IIH subunit 2, putative [Plasmodium malariae]|uniref:General transcription factor IIH subunit n=1 Tax=Plasmodium malariae TaxID=5858 RepID=A0A1C3L292_PLAMA|nr:general transcription factor IIH subunit 2, putative [Plasmodium malariae]SBT80680.1 general transcription factor IIH subunit 2, putative [Plasmodium malariae]SCP03262.1 general transcription factor IIH subunit 2, putative [Plasmodium malariae]